MKLIAAAGRKSQKKDRAPRNENSNHFIIWDIQMNPVKRLSIYTGGIPLFLFMALIIILFWVLIMSILHFSPNGADFFGCILFVWLISYLIAYLLSNRISVTDTTLSFSIVSREINHRLFPIVKKTTINLDDIRGVFLGKPKLIKEFLNEQKQGIECESNIDINGFLYKLTPMIQILSKNGKPFYIDTKPFTKKDILQLLRMLQALGIPIVDPQNVTKKQI